MLRSWIAGLSIAAASACAILPVSAQAGMIDPALKSARFGITDVQYRPYPRHARPYHRGGRGFPIGAGIAAGIAAGALIGGALNAAGQPAYVEGPPDYVEGDPAYVQGRPAYVEDADAAPQADDDYCASRFRSYDPASGTYMGYDGLRHACP